MTGFIPSPEDSEKKQERSQVEYWRSIHMASGI